MTEPKIGDCYYLTELYEMNGVRRQAPGLSDCQSDVQ